MKKKNDKGLTVGRLITTSEIRTPVTLNDEEEEQKLRETLQCSTIERRAPLVPYLEIVGPSGLELQRMALEEGG